MQNSPNTAITLRLEGQKVTIVTDDTGAGSNNAAALADRANMKSLQTPPKPQPSTVYLNATAPGQNATMNETSPKKNKADIERGLSLTHDDGPSALNESHLSNHNGLNHIGLERAASPGLVDTGYHTRLGQASN